MYERTKNAVLLRSVHFLPIMSANGPAIKGAIEFLVWVKSKLVKNLILPIKAPNGTKLAIQDNSSAVGITLKGDWLISFNLANIGEVHPILQCFLV